MSETTEHPGEMTPEQIDESRYPNLKIMRICEGGRDSFRFLVDGEEPFCEATGVWVEDLDLHLSVDQTRLTINLLVDGKTEIETNMLDKLELSMVAMQRGREGHQAVEELILTETFL